MFPRRYRAWIKIVSQRFFENLGLRIRTLFCFALGLAVLLITSGDNYDTRFSLRGPQKVDDDVVIIQVTRDDMDWVDGGHDAASRNLLWSLKEIVETSDSYFWHPVVWERALSTALSSGAKAVAVAIFFGEEAVRGTISPEQQLLFKRPNVFWAARSDSQGLPILPGLSFRDGRNAGILDLRADHDGKIRHFLSLSSSLPHLAIRTLNYLAQSRSQPTYSSLAQIGELINYNGPQGTFRTYAFSDLLRGKLGARELDGRIIIFDLKDSPSHVFQTPVGPLSIGEILANILSSFLHAKWIVEIPFWMAVLYLFAILSITLWIIMNYPQGVAFVFLGFLSIGIVALSAAFFDLWGIWLPVAAPLATILITHVVIYSYLLSQSEKFSWESEREMLLLSQLEGLKNNFLSLISHDLKNPLAKIQGIVDRVIAENEKDVPDHLKFELGSIKQISEELKQYITTILQLTRVEARDIKLTKEVCDINSIIVDSLERLKPLAEQKKIKIETSFEPLFSMELDRTLIGEVVLNLVENAIKYSSPESEIHISSQEVGTDIRVEVADQGGGISEEDLPKVFEKFYRGSGDQIIKSAGTGLGLYLAKYFIELHGGKVFINSQLGVGTKIGFTLPLEEPEEDYAKFASSHR